MFRGHSTITLSGVPLVQVISGSSEILKSERDNTAEGLCNMRFRCEAQMKGVEQ